GRLELAHGGVHVRLRAGADGDAGPRAAQGEGRGATDTCGRAGHDRERACKVHIRSKYTPGAGTIRRCSEIRRRLSDDRYTASDFGRYAFPPRGERRGSRDGRGAARSEEHTSE